MERRERRKGEVDRRQRYRDKHKALGLCVDCPRVAYGGRTRCDLHKTRPHKPLENYLKTKRYEREHRCKRCSRPLSEEDKMYCFECHKSSYERY